MEQVREWLKGKKTYFILAAAGAIWFGESAGFLPVGSLESSEVPLEFIGGGTMVAKLQRLVQYTYTISKEG